MTTCTECDVICDDCPVLTLAVRPDEATAVGSHVAVLTGLADILHPRRILELGSGLRSTPLFLDRSVFTDVEYLCSVENNTTWYDDVQRDVGNDARLDHVLTGCSIADEAATLDLGYFDFIFIDDSASGAEREVTIGVIADGVGPGTLIAIHDYEWPPYRARARAFDHRMTLDAYNPCTGVCWNGESQHESALVALRQYLKSSRA